MSKRLPSLSLPTATVWILHRFQMVSTGVMHKNLKILYMSQEENVLIAGFWAYQGTYCRFFYPANRLEGWSSMEKVLIAGFVYIKSDTVSVLVAGGGIAPPSFRV